jgi:hypothetical protein
VWNLPVGEVQEQQPPPQHPPVCGADGNEDGDAPTLANTLSIRTAPGCPAEHVAGELASDIGRRSSNTDPHVRHLYSYNGMKEMVAAGARPTVTTADLRWLTVHVTPTLPVTAPTVRPEEDLTTETGEPVVAHIVKTEPGENAAAKVLEARITGTPIEALCGHVWVPSRDPRQLPMCQACREIYDTYRMFNEGLGETPNE